MEDWIRACAEEFFKGTQMSAGNVLNFVMTMLNKKLELMLTRCAKACSQSVRLSPAISLQFMLGVCTAAKDRKKSIKTAYFGSSGSFKVTNVDKTEKLITSA